MDVKREWRIFYFIRFWVNLSGWLKFRQTLKYKHQIDAHRHSFIHSKKKKRERERSSDFGHKSKPKVDLAFPILISISRVNLFIQSFPLRIAVMPSSMTIHSCNRNQTIQLKHQQSKSKSKYFSISVVASQFQLINELFQANLLIERLI